jgi:hypothetical protein
MYLCRWTDTLIADEHGVYDPSHGADRMVLGIRGQVSELELDNSIHRMVEARWSKARRGELLTIPPAGYDVDDVGALVITSDEAVVDGIRTVFSKFRELGTARQVFVWWRTVGRKFPVRNMDLRSHPVEWREPKYGMILRTLGNPIYSGAFVFGRTETVRQLDPDDPRRLQVRRTRREEWPILIKGHHDAYISFEDYLKVQEQLEGNTMYDGSKVTDGMVVREGPALLQGLVRCGLCGRRMTVGYGGHRSARGRTMQYRCKALRSAAVGSDCQTVGGRRIDQLVTQLFLEATEPGGVEAAQKAGDLALQERNEAERYWKLQIEKAAYEAGRAERQFNAVEPENRLVARELERRWNVRLSELETMRSKGEAAQSELQSLSDAELERAKQLGADLEAVWNAATTTDRDRKRLLHCVIEEVQLKTEAERISIRILWKGGAVTDREVSRQRPGTTHTTSEETVSLVRRLAEDFDDGQIARILSKQGRRSGLGNLFTKSSVMSLRGKNQIPACPKPRARDPREGPFTADEAAVELRVCMSTIHRWLRDGILAGTQATPGAPWQIVLTEEVRQRLSGGEAPPGWVGLSEASQQLGLSKQHVAYLVSHGKLKAMRTKIGSRDCWKIDVSSADCGQQPGIFDQMSNEQISES